MALALAIAAIFSLSRLAWAKDKQTAPGFSEVERFAGSVPTDATTSAFLIALEISVVTFAPAS